MNTYTSTLNGSQSQASAQYSAHTGKHSNAISARDNRTETLSMQRNLQEMADNSIQVNQLKSLVQPNNGNETPNKPAQLAAVFGNSVQLMPIQRQVPRGNEQQKPVANTGSYQARGGQNVNFNSQNHPRGNFQFGSKTRYEVFQNYNPQMVGNRIVSVRASNGEQMNVEAIQLDHRTSWDTISTAMHNHNQRQNINWSYSLWDAKMYYNDQPNLHPAPANLNAAAGAMGVVETARLHYGLESGVGLLQTAQMNLQQTLNAMSPSIGETIVPIVWGRLNAISGSMNQLSNDLTNANW